MKIDLVRAVTALTLHLPLALQAQTTPGDSVINGRYRGNSGIQFQAVGEGLSVLLNDVNMDSQTDRYFVLYGPFTNTSDAILTVELVHTGTASDHAVIGIVNGVQRASDPGRVEFRVLPGDVFHLKALDATRLRAFANKNGVSPSMAGVPSATAFSRPTGEFVSCLDIYYFLTTPEQGDVRFDRTVYFYRAGSMSDKSDQQSRDADPVPQGMTTGRKPLQEVACDQAPPVVY